MADFLWHKVSEKEKEEIEKQAKKIVMDFSKKLESVKGKVGDFGVEREDFEREEGKDCSEIDRKIMFENAPNKNGDFIVGEKKEW